MLLSSNVCIFVTRVWMKIIGSQTLTMHNLLIYYSITLKGNGFKLHTVSILTIKWLMPVRLIGNKYLVAEAYSDNVTAIYFSLFYNGDCISYCLSNIYWK